MTENQKTAEWRRVRLRGELVINKIGALHQKLLPLPGECSHVIVDLSEVEDLDTSGVQLLIALKREFSGAGRRLRLVGHSPVVLEFFALYGLVGFFGDRVVLKNGQKKQYGFDYGLKRDPGFA